MSTKRGEWSQDWPMDEGWYWFCDMEVRHPVVEPARALKCGNTMIWGRGAEGMSKRDYPHAWWRQMETPPELPEVTP